MRLLFAALAGTLLLQVQAQEGWWMREPIRWVQTNLRETDAAMDTRRLATQLADMRAGDTSASRRESRTRPPRATCVDAARPPAGAAWRLALGISPPQGV